MQYKQSLSLRDKSLPDFSFEKPLWKDGFKFIGGVDEVGRGALAGPVFAGCVIFKINQEINILINDSKKLTPKQREVASVWIKKNSLSYGIGSATAAEIDNVGIVKATNKAFRRAIKNCSLNLDFLLIDAFYLPNIKNLRRKQQLAIVKGDSLSLSIAAASIIAKVERDKLMINISNNQRYKKYKWNKNKGYGTKEHREAINTFGKSRLHRVSFLLKFS